ncbi:MAG: alkylation response protein AidB-like acyl-CoA dehydrogenase [Candidatus Azotimanducaceae bacterium]|jgi:alkylation response protein AidB-like acyl-CoA dehydrogenase
MDFSFSEEQTLLQNSVQRFIQNDYGFDQRQKLLKTDDGFSRENWANFAELGWLGLPFGEESGGYGGGAIETMIMMEEFGKGLVIEPYISTVLLAGKSIEFGGSPEQKESLLAGIIEGNKLGALAFVEPQARFNLADTLTTATKSGEGYVLNGFKGLVLGGPSADFFVVPARTSGDQQDTTGISLFIVESAAAGVSVRNYATVDGLRASELSLENASGELLGEESEGYALLEKVIDHAIVAIAAEAVGAMEVLYKTTVEYCKTREQFGQPIGKFQVLQHKMVDMFVEHEQTKSLVYMAAMRLDEEYGVVARKAVSGLKVQVGKGGRFVGQSAVQLHGGMGMTDELNVGHYFKRLTTIDTLFGNSDFHLKKYATIA